MFAVIGSDNYTKNNWNGIRNRNNTITYVGGAGANRNTTIGLMKTVTTPISRPMSKINSTLPQAVLLPTKLAMDRLASYRSTKSGNSRP